MKINIKDYRIVKTKKYFKTQNLFFFVNGINRNSIDWLITQQELISLQFNYYKVLNQITNKTLNDSIYNKIKPIVKGSTFLLKPKHNQNFFKNTILNTFNLLFFELLIVKLNNKIYSLNSVKNHYSLKYKETNLLLYQFNMTCLKTCYKFSK